MNETKVDKEGRLHSWCSKLWLPKVNNKSQKPECKCDKKAYRGQYNRKEQSNGTKETSLRV